MKGTIGLIRNGAIYAVLAMILLIIVIVTIGMAQTSYRSFSVAIMILRRAKFLNFLVNCY